MGTIQIDGSTPKITVGNATAEDATILFDGNAQDFYIALDDSADDLLIGLGSTVGSTPAISIDENLAVKTYGDITMTGTTPVLTIGDAGAEDTAIVFDGNAQDFYIALDDSADDLVIGLGSTVGTTPAISINEDRDVTISDGAIDFDVASHDGTNGLKLGGTLVTTTAAELNLLDGDTSVGSSITLADADGFVVNDGGTMKTIPATDISDYAGGGKILQAQYYNAQGWSTHTGDTDWHGPVFTDSITCAASTSNVLVTGSFHISWDSNNAAITNSQVYFKIERVITGGATTEVYAGTLYDNFPENSGMDWIMSQHVGFSFIDAPSTTSAIAYNASTKSVNDTATVNIGTNDYNKAIALLEIDGS